MKITIREGNKHSFYIYFPTRMAFSPTLISLGLRIARKKHPGIPHISRSALQSISRAVKETRQRNRRYELVDVETDDGDLVKIEL